MGAVSIAWRIVFETFEPFRGILQHRNLLREDIVSVLCLSYG